jgi:hypothetical protein
VQPRGREPADQQAQPQGRAERQHNRKVREGLYPPPMEPAAGTWRHQPHFHG